MKRRGIVFYLWGMLLILVFGGCSHHIDITAYKAVTLEPLPNQLKIDVSNKETMRVVILNIDDHINSFAQKNNVGHLLAQDLGNKLVADRRMQVIKRLEKPTFFNEQRLNELVKRHNINLESSDYLLTGKITRATRKKTKTKIKR
jgi:curli biogenesis system outer membrane secretion channel CsgG